ncbi:MAG: peptidyl-alpha-hydroxyglycine alpha-amidating lyase family protein [Gemmatimonadota bacterium]
MRLSVVISLLVAAAAHAIPAAAQLTLPNPYRVVDEAWGDLPEGRTWGAISAIYPAPDGHSIWVADRCGGGSCVGQESLPMIFQFALDGRLMQSFGAGMAAVPHGMTVDHQGNVWLVDTAWLGSSREGVGHVVRKFSPGGELLMTLGEWGQAGDEPNRFNRPSDVLVAPNGDIFVADGHDATGNNRIVKFSADGRFLSEWGRTGGDIGEFRDPHALAMDSQGRLFVGDRGNHRIQLFDQQGTHLATWTQFGSPSGLYIDRNDILYVADSDSRATTNPGWRRGIYIGSARDGWVTAFIQDPEPNPDDLVTSGAEGVAVDALGNLYGAEVGPRTLRKYERID